MPEAGRVATGTVGSDGNFSITLPEAQKNGETLHITLTDGAGNTSAANTVTAPDNTAPEKPEDITVNGTGTEVSGKGEAGATVSVTAGDGRVLGSATVAADGTFTVTLSEPQTSGDTLSVILTDTAGNISALSTIQYVDETLVAHDDRHSMAVTAVQDNLNGSSGEISQLAGISLLGDNVVLSLLSSNSFKFTVDKNTSENVTLYVSGGVTLSTAALLSTILSILGVSSFSADLSVIDTSTGKVVQTISDAVTISGAGVSLVYNGSAYVTDLVAGTYTVAVSTASSDSLLQTLINWLSKFGAATSLNIEISDSVQYTFGSAEGNVLTNDASGDVADTGKNIHVTSVVSDNVEGAGSLSVSDSGTTTITGAYGTLTIAGDGSFSYQPYANSASNIGKSDVFTYTITDASGATTTAKLTINITGTSSTAVNDTVSLADTTVFEDGSAVSYAASTVVSGTSVDRNSTATGTEESKFTVDADTLLENATITLTFRTKSSGSTVTLSGTVTIYKVTTAEDGTITRNAVYTETWSGGKLVATVLTSGSGSTTISLKDLDLPAGDYVASFTYTAKSSFISTGSTTVTISDQLTGTSIDTSHHLTTEAKGGGNIFDGSDSDNIADTLGSKYQSFTVSGVDSSGNSVAYIIGRDDLITDSSGNSVSDHSVTLTGKYGTLALSTDGSYTYTLNAGTDTSAMTSKETFSYTLNDSDGTQSSAVLTIDLKPVINGSTNDDSINSTAYDDTFTTGAGADMVVYKLLADDDTGGNGSDTWQDFSVSDGDHIDVSQLLVGWDGASSTLGNYISVTHSEGNTLVSIDRDGTGTTYHSASLMTLEGVIVTLDELIDNSTAIS